MIDYKKYKKVLEILNSYGVNGADDPYPTTEDKATAICELFDEKPINQRFEKLPYTVPCDVNVQKFQDDMNKINF